MDLFIDTKKTITKQAAPLARLSQNTDDWQAEIINEVHRQVPFVGQFDTKLDMKELDSEKRYALGMVIVSNKLAMNPRDEGGGGDTNIAAIPVVVHEGKMFPLDVFKHSGRAWPLTKERIERAMFRPQMFEAARKGAGDNNLMDQLLPPDRSGGSFSKMGSALLLDQVLPVASLGDRGRLDRELEDPGLRYALRENDATRNALMKIASVAPAPSAAEIMKLATSRVPPVVVQVLRLQGGGFKVKTANPNALADTEMDMDRPTAEKTLGHDVVRRVEDDGSVTINADPVVKDVMAEVSIKVAEEFGQYKVRTVDGKELAGWVFPSVMDFDGTQLLTSVFSNGSESAVQDAIAGNLISKSSALIDEDPKGFGMFYLSRQGSVVGLVPVSIKGRLEDPEGNEGFLVETMLGEEIKVTLAHGLVGPQQLEDTHYAIPADVGWLPLRSNVVLHKDADGFTKTASVIPPELEAEILYDGASYSVRGRGVEKIASAGINHTFVGPDQAMFVLAIMGHEPAEAMRKLAHVGVHRSLRTWSRPLTTLNTVQNRAREKVASRLRMPPKNFLLKTAALVRDPTCVDHVLSLGFLNPENVDVFVSSIPELEATLSRLSEMLIAARVGLSVDKDALEHGVKHIDTVVGDLKEMSQQA